MGKKKKIHTQKKKFHINVGYTNYLLIEPSLGIKFDLMQSEFLIVPHKTSYLKLYYVWILTPNLDMECVNSDLSFT